MLHSTAVVQQMILNPNLSINECLGVRLNDIHVYVGTYFNFQYNVKNNIKVSNYIRHELYSRSCTLV